MFSSNVHVLKFFFDNRKIKNFKIRKAKTKTLFNLVNGHTDARYDQNRNRHYKMARRRTEFMCLH